MADKRGEIPPNPAISGKGPRELKQLARVIMIKKLSLSFPIYLAI
jgi:hypothetical protein